MCGFVAQACWCPLPSSRLASVLRHGPLQRCLLRTATRPAPLTAHTMRPNCLQGYIYGCVSALLSAVAAVYTEWVLKKNNDTLYWQNMLLYGFGAFFNFLNLAHRCGGKWGWVVRVAGWRAGRQLLLGLGAAAGSLER